jgi:hypothetical protein
MVITKKLAISVMMGTVSLELICDDAYEANVLFDDIIDRLRANEGLELRLQQPKALDNPDA